MYWQYTTALASFVLAVTNPELKKSAVSTIADFVFIVIPPLMSEVWLTGSKSARTQGPGAGDKPRDSQAEWPSPGTAMATSQRLSARRRLL